MTNQSTKRRIIIIVFVVIVVLIICLIIGGRLKHSNSLLVTFSNGNNTKNGRETFVLYNFYNPSCPCCQKFLPTWNILVQQIGKINVIEPKLVDVTNPENENLTFYYNVTEVPSIILVTPNNVVKYVGDRELENLTSFVHTYVR